MFKKMMKHLTDNPGLKILSILFALILWLVVVNYDNPDKTVTFHVPVTVVEEQVLEQKGKVYNIAEKSKVATFYVTGKRNIVEKLKASDFTVTADLSQYFDYDEEDGKLLAPVTVVPNAPYDKKILVIDQKTRNAEILLEDLATEQSYVVGETTGTPAKGYAVGEVSVNPNLIKISGPQSLVSQVKRIVASVSVKGLTEDCTVSVTPVLYDEKGNVIESSQIELSQSSVTVSVQILGTKTIPVRCETTWNSADGYLFVGLEYAPEEITIKGDPSVLNHISAITIPGEAINLDGAVGDVENSIDITPYLTEAGVTLVNAEENKIAVKALVEQLQTKVIELPVTSLEVLNAPEVYEVRYDSAVVRVSVRGRSRDIEDLTAEQLKATIDLNELSLGTHTLPVEIVLDEKFQVMGEVTLGVHIVEPGTELPEIPGGGNGTDSENTGDRSGTVTNPND